MWLCPLVDFNPMSETPYNNNKYYQKLHFWKFKKNQSFLEESAAVFWSKLYAEKSGLFFPQTLVTFIFSAHILEKADKKQLFHSFFQDPNLWAFSQN